MAKETRRKILDNPDAILAQKNIFDALDELFDDTGIPRGSQEAMSWFRRLARQLFDDTDAIPEETFLRDDTRIIQKSGYKRRGNFYIFNYLPKTASSLKYFDTLPLVLLLDFTKDGFYGLNLHYLQNNLRERLFLLLRQRLVGSPDDPFSRININYDTLKSQRQFRLYRPCLKRYKTKNIGSRILRILPKDWDFAIHLPMERFKKVNRQVVYQESRRKLGEEKQGVAEQ
tara:strand:- start:333 stop:1019 length:687 start_codon:yes stop_codon:yes gene_type:complete